MTAPRLDLGELRRLHEKATPGPWRLSCGDVEQLSDGGSGYPLDFYPDCVTIIESGDDYQGDRKESDVEAMVAAYNALPALLAIAEAAEAFMSEEHDCDDDQPCLYHDALSAALAAVRKEEKGD